MKPKRCSEGILTRRITHFFQERQIINFSRIFDLALIEMAQCTCTCNFIRYSMHTSYAVLSIFFYSTLMAFTFNSEVQLHYALNITPAPSEYSRKSVLGNYSIDC